MRFIAYIGLFCFVMACFTSCSKDPINGLEIRVENESDFDFEEVYVNTSGGEGLFGTINSGERSTYESFDSAYRYAFVRLKVNGVEYKWQPIDYVGETLLEAGRYTYVLDLDDLSDRYAMQLRLEID